MEERRQFGFRVRPNYGQVLGYIQEREPITLELPKRNASVYMASHFYLDDFPQSSEPLSDQPMPHTHVNPAEAFDADDEGYRGQPFPRPPRDMLRQRSFFSDSSSDFGGVDPVQALRMDGFDAPQPPTLGSRLRESGISAAETAIAGIGLGARQYAAGATIRGLGRREQWLDRTLRIPSTPEGLAPPPWPGCWSSGIFAFPQAVHHLSGSRKRAKETLVPRVFTSLPSTSVNLKFSVRAVVRLVLHDVAHALVDDHLADYVGAQRPQDVRRVAQLPGSR